MPRFLVTVADSVSRSSVFCFAIVFSPLIVCSNWSFLSVSGVFFGALFAVGVEEQDSPWDVVCCRRRGTGTDPGSLTRPKRWQASYRLPPTSHLLPATSVLLPTAYYLRPSTNYILPTTCYLLPATCYLPPATSYLLPATSYLLPTTYNLLPFT